MDNLRTDIYFFVIFFSNLMDRKNLNYRIFYFQDILKCFFKKRVDFIYKYFKMRVYFMNSLNFLLFIYLKQIFRNIDFKIDIFLYLFLKIRIVVKQILIFEIVNKFVIIQGFEFLFVLVMVV